jgi:hypothetical protein
MRNFSSWPGRFSSQRPPMSPSALSTFVRPSAAIRRLGPDVQCRRRPRAGRKVDPHLGQRVVERGGALEQADALERPSLDTAPDQIAGEPLPTRVELRGAIAEHLCRLGVMGEHRPMAIHQQDPVRVVLEDLEPQNRTIDAG